MCSAGNPEDEQDEFGSRKGGREDRDSQRVSGGIQQVPLLEFASVSRQGEFWFRLLAWATTEGNGRRMFSAGAVGNGQTMSRIWLDEGIKDGLAVGVNFGRAMTQIQGSSDSGDLTECRGEFWQDEAKKRGGHQHELWHGVGTEDEPDWMRGGRGRWGDLQRSFTTEFN